MRRLLLLLPLALLAAGCRQDARPADVMPPDRMADFLAEACRIEGRYAAETRYRFNATSPRANRSYDSLLDALHVDSALVQRSLDYYLSHLDEYQPIADTVAARFERSAAPGSHQ